MTAAATPELSGVVVHWRNEELLVRLIEAWPKDPRFELIVVDNSATASPTHGVVYLKPEKNLGFAGGCNLGWHRARAPLILFLNPDALPEAGALEQLLQGFAENPAAGGLAPKLFGADGEGQHRWQLRPLPTAWTLLAQALLVPVGQGSAEEPKAGTAVMQPAAAALALRRQVLEAVGGMDEAFYPAWFEDVDLALRLRRQGSTLLYWPAARFLHQLGGSVPQLGYGPFLWIYYRNLMLYLSKHHGRSSAALAQPLLAMALTLRLVLLPLRKPKRAASRSQAAAALWSVLLGAISGWRLPRRFERRFAAARPGER